MLKAMEFHAFKKALEFLLNSGICVSQFVSYRDLAILACMKENHKDILHQIDLWHLKKSRFIVICGCFVIKGVDNKVV